MRNYGIPLFFSKIALHGGGHLELKKMHKGNFWGIFGIRLGRCPCIIPEKISFLQFYSRFNPNALALFVHVGYLELRILTIRGDRRHSHHVSWPSARSMLTPCLIVAGPTAQMVSQRRFSIGSTSRVYWGNYITLLY